MTRARWIIVAVTAAILAAGVLAALAYSPGDAKGATPDLHRQAAAGNALDGPPDTYLRMVDSFSGR